jgi:hypothetical protein
MYRVIDTIPLKNNWVADLHPVLAELGHGIIVVIDPEQLKSPPDIAGKEITVTRPDGSSIRLVVAQVPDSPGGAVGIFFHGVLPEQVPRNSILAW